MSGIFFREKLGGNFMRQQLYLQQWQQLHNATQQRFTMTGPTNAAKPQHRR
jgi:hypothetical protein